jgi:hypothetical protein
LAVAEHGYGDKKAYLIALIYARRRQADQAFTWLERGIRQRDGDMLYIKGDPMAANIVSDPRYTLMMKKLHLAE